MNGFDRLQESMKKFSTNMEAQVEIKGDRLAGLFADFVDEVATMIAPPEKKADPKPEEKKPEPEAKK